MWGKPLVFLLCGGGIFFMLYSRFTPFRYFKHAINVLQGKYDDPDAPGDINHFEALSSALSATIGMGNISGVAVAIATGGPGAVFWMWISALFGIATKFFTCTLSIMYRGKDSAEHIQGGTMYMLEEGRDNIWKPLRAVFKPIFKPLAILFSLAGLFGALPIFQANQLTQALRSIIYVPNGWVAANAHFIGDLITGLVIMIIVSIVIFGGIKRIGRVASRMVPFMVVMYLICVFIILGIHINVVPHYLGLIVTDAFSAKAAMGGALGQLIIIGFKRAAFSNEAGIGTATMAHGAAKTKEPVREGLVAMMGPAIDTILVCTLTAMAILVTGAWNQRELLTFNPQQANYTHEMMEGATQMQIKDGILKNGSLTLAHHDIAKFYVDKNRTRGFTGSVNFKNDTAIIRGPNGEQISRVYGTYLKNGIALTSSAFNEALGFIGPFLLMIAVTVFAFSTLFTYSYYGTKCFGYLFGAGVQEYYKVFYVISIVLGSVVSIDAVINLIDGMFAVMAIPTMTAALLLAPRVREAANDYFSRMKSFEIFD